MQDRNDDNTIRESGHAPILASTYTPQKPCLTVLHGGPVGMVYTLLAGTETLIGRGDEADVRIEEQRVSRKHAVIKVSQDGQTIIEDQGSSNGTFVNGVQVHRQELKDGDRIQVGSSCIIKFSYQDDLEYELQQELASGIKDALTGLYTKKYLLDRLDTEFAHARRHNEQLGLLIFDIDHFKKIGRRYGQAAGDFSVKEVTHVVSQILRAGDVFVRYDGERFAVLARDIGDEGAVLLAQRMRGVVQNHQFEFNGTQIPVSVSIGIATLSDKVKKAAKLIKIAENWLRKTKKKDGQNGIGGDAMKTSIHDSDAVPTLYQVSNRRT